MGCVHVDQPVQYVPERHQLVIQTLPKLLRLLLVQQLLVVMYVTIFLISLTMFSSFIRAVSNAGFDIIYHFFSALRLVARSPPTTNALLEHAFVDPLVQHVQGVRHTVSTLLLLELLHLRENCQPSKIQLVPPNVR